MIQLFKHHVHQESIDNVVTALKSGWTGLGPRTEAFENKVKEYLDTPCAVALNSGTSALQLAMLLLNAPKGSYIITTPLTFISTNHCIVQAGSIPIFADIQPSTGNIDPMSIERLLKQPFVGSRVKGIVVVHYGGQPVDMDEVYDLSNKYNIDVVEDAAHAFGAEYQNSKIGCKHSKLVAFSFHSVKPFAIGDGGLITTYEPAFEPILKQLRWCGIDKSTSDRYTKTSYKWDYNISMVGFKYHMNDIQAAIGLGQLANFEADQVYKQTLVDLYRTQLQDIPQIEMLE